MASKKVLAHLKDREGVIYESYLDSLKKPTAGVGHLLTEDEQKLYPIGTKIPKDQVDKWLKEDLAKAETAAKIQADQMRAKGLAVDPNFEESLISVNFQLGTGWTTKFPSAWKNLQSGDYKGAVEEIKFTSKGSNVESDWAKQTPTRVNDFTQAIKNQADYKPGKQSSVFTGEKIDVAGTDLSGIFTNETESQYGKGPGIKYPNQNLSNAQKDLGTVELPPDQTITPYRETIKEDVTVRPDQIRTNNDYQLTSIPNDAYQYPVDEQQERARRSMMQGNYDDRMDDYQYSREYQEDYPYLYPRNTGSYALPQQQAAQRMMGGGMGYAQGGAVNQAQNMASSNQQNQGLSLTPANQNQNQSLAPSTQTTQGLASLGRGGDSTLVHMQPQEVAGLQQLAQANGTSLTTNPMTGYPEAFNLGGMFKSALPIAAGFAMPGVGSAIAAGALTGAGVAAVSGDDVLAGTLTGGMGGYSGFGLEGALMGPGLETVGSTAASNTIGAGTQVGLSSAPATGAANTIGSGATFGLNSAPGATSAGTPVGLSSAPSAGSGTALTQGSVFDPSINPGAPITDTMKQNIGVFETGYADVQGGLPGEQYLKKTFVPGDNIDLAMELGGPAVSMGLGGLEVSDFYDDEVEFNDPRDKYDPYSKLNLNKDTGISTALAADTGLRLLAQGGFLEGSGDGMSDDIPAMIDGDQPAALSTGEYVVAADVVSGLGNGSSEAGAKRLHAMMDRVRKATTGRTAQAKEINPSKYMPA